MTLTFKRIFLLGLILWILLGLLKVWFFNNQLFSSTTTQEFVFWLLTAIVSVALVRRLGVMQYLECFFVTGLWILGDLLADGLVTINFAGSHMFATVSYWVSFLVLALAAFLFHKKRHVQIRKEHKSHHGGHGHH